MPDTQSPPELESIHMDSEELKLAGDELSRAYALALVKETYFNYSTWRANNHDRRWTEHDALYFGYRAQKFWPGTKIPRANLSRQIVFDQVETAIPAIEQAIFAPDEDWFEVQPEPGADPKEARAVQSHLSYLLAHNGSDEDLSAEEEISAALQSALLYGNGGLEVYYDSEHKRPCIKAVDPRDFFIDPGTNAANVSRSRAVIRRRFMTVDEVAAYRVDKRFTIPTDAQLMYMANNRPLDVGDATKSAQESSRGVSYTPGASDYSAFPAARTLEVLIYYDNNRIIWVFNRQYVAYNEKNPYGFIPFCFMPCYKVPFRFYAQSIADVQEGNQKYIEGLMNGRLDELSLAIFPPRVQTSGASLTPAQQRWGPGHVFQVREKDDVAVIQQQNATARIYEDVGYIEGNVEKRTGIMGSGTPRPSNANRTLGGIQAQQGSASSRLQKLVKNAENYLIIPMLYKLYKMVQLHSYPGQLLPALGEQEEFMEVGAEAFSKPVRFRMFAASRMMTREKLQANFPFLAQYILGGPFLTSIQKTGRTVDFDEMFQMLQDATGTGRRYKLIRPITLEEQQALQQPPPEVVAAQQKSEKDAQTRIQVTQMGNETEIKKALIAKQPDMGQIQIEQQKAQLESQLGQLKMQLEQQKAEMDIQVKQIELQIKIQEGQMKQGQMQAEHEINMQTANDERHQALMDHAFGIQQSQQTHEQGMSQQREAGAQKIQMDRESGTQKLKLDKQAGEAKTDVVRKTAQIKSKAKRTDAAAKVSK